MKKRKSPEPRPLRLYEGIFLQILQANGQNVYLTVRPDLQRRVKKALEKERWFHSYIGSPLVDADHKLVIRKHSAQHLVCAWVKFAGAIIRDDMNKGVPLFFKLTEHKGKDVILPDAMPATHDITKHPVIGDIK